jgi:hypothetical protein
MNSSSGRINIDPDKGSNRGAMIFFAILILIIIIIAFSIREKPEEVQTAPAPTEQVQ